MSYHAEMEGLLDHQLSFSDDEIDSTFKSADQPKNPETSPLPSRSNGARQGNGAVAADTNIPTSYSIQNDDTDLLMLSSDSPNTRRNDDIVELPSVETRRKNLHHMTRQISLQQYNKETETLETIKCLVSSVLFFGIVALVIIVAFTINPEM